MSFELSLTLRISMKMFEQYLHTIPEYSPNTPASLLLMPTDPLDSLLGLTTTSRRYQTTRAEMDLSPQQSLSKYIVDVENERWQATKEVMGYIKATFSLSRGRNAPLSSASCWTKDGE